MELIEAVGSMLVRGDKMVKLIETTTFHDGREERHEKKFPNIHSLYKSLGQSGINGEVIYNLKKHKRAVVPYDDAETVIEIEIPQLEVVK